ncbi:unnamed protein product [Danaus chrysippus]|uniref:(African queen) hypothetical protein n=1 Tax=Danaus chrysippus TaxID=151541 RepID=A0A8J2VZ11_9NEOP|nr:unnamed protein product [Danaus chrysippus]
MPLMRIRSVEIVFEDEMSTCTDTGLLDRSIELIQSDSDDSTQCVDDLHLQEREDSVTLNADVELSDDSFSQDAQIYIPKIPIIQISNDAHDQIDSLTIIKDDVTLSLNVSELGDSGRFTEEACSSHVDKPLITYDALLSRSFDSVNTERMLSMCEISDVSDDKSKLYEYIDSNSDSSDTAICDEEHPGPKHVSLDTNSEDTSLCESYDLQYDSFVDIGKF